MSCAHSRGFSTANAVSPDEFDGYMAAVGISGELSCSAASADRSTAYPLAVALSGGADSMALTLLLAEFLERHRAPSPLLAITVDHRLRPESTDEARHVGELCTSRFGPGRIHHVIMQCEWGTATPRKSKLQEAARASRYELLDRCCAEHGVRHLFVAHNLGDQLETVLFRLGRASGVDGLAGMDAVTPLPTNPDCATRVVRPLLGVSKASLKATCERFGQQWVEDPSNESLVYDRVRIRKALEAIERQPDGNETLSLLSDLQRAAARARDEFDSAERALRERHTLRSTDDAVVLSSAILTRGRDVFDELVIRVLRGVVRDVGCPNSPPRLSSLEGLLRDLRVLASGKKVTLGGCQVLCQQLMAIRATGDGLTHEGESADRSESAEATDAEDEKEDAKEEKLKVVVRVRPLQRHEEPCPDGKAAAGSHQPDGGGDAVELRIRDNSVSWEKNGQLKTLLADAVFQGDASQDDVFRSVEDCIDGLLAGFDCSVFAYGQTGTGKTHTMSGLPHHDDGREDFSDGADGFDMRPEFGIVPRGIAKLFDAIDAARSSAVSFSVYCSFVEIYNEKIYDILAPAPSDALSTSPRKAASHRAGWNRAQPAKEAPSLPMRQKLDGSVFVDGLTSRKTSSRAELLAAFRDGSRHREVRDNLYNQHSSRGHSVFQVTLRRDEGGGDGGGTSPQSRLSRLFFVDLAGSEKWHVSGSELSDKYATELAAINKSLSALTNCVLALTQRERAHVPFRDSVLTRLLQSCLQGSGRTAFIVTLSPARASLDESCATLRFAERLRAIRCRPVRRRVFSNELLGEQRHYYERQIQSMRAEVTRLRELLKKAQRRNQEIAELSASAANQALVAENKRLKELLRNAERQRLGERSTAKTTASAASSPQQQAARQILVSPRPVTEDDHAKATTGVDDATVNGGGLATPPGRRSRARDETVEEATPSDDEQLHSLVHRLQSNEARLHWMLEAEMEAQNTRAYPAAAPTAADRVAQPVNVARSWAVERALQRKLVSVPAPVRATQEPAADSPPPTMPPSKRQQDSVDKENSTRQPSQTSSPRRPLQATSVRTNPSPSPGPSQSGPSAGSRRAPAASTLRSPPQSLADEPPVKSASILKLVGSSAADKMGKSKDELVDEYKRARRAELEAMLRTMVQR
ncbi:hypothetical protein P43SY_002027 [Pythium insidiosum]|uniref:tRNA(Ile)-lysidine synthetase n=1 Tax=Pythium insidiosum TaxID=114742 RepID=A0AAD5MDV4_PYTIN|nr:hypothetical protein P43SY_002027 [Pythium insidiosum]